MRSQALTRYIALAILTLANAAAADLRLADAVKRRDAKAFAKLLAEHADVNAAQPDGATALSWAWNSWRRSSSFQTLLASRSVLLAKCFCRPPPAFCKLTT